MEQANTSQGDIGMKAAATLDGIRLCRFCGRTCHGGAYRTAWGTRRVYFCCESHARSYYANKWYRWLEKMGVTTGWDDLSGLAYSDEYWEDDKKYYLEPIDVVAPKKRRRPAERRGD